MYENDSEVLKGFEDSFEDDLLTYILMHKDSLTQFKNEDEKQAYLEELWGYDHGQLRKEANDLNFKILEEDKERNIWNLNFFSTSCEEDNDSGE